MRENDIPYKGSETRADGLRRKAGSRKKDCRTLAECTATVDDMFDVFQQVREYLVVTPRIPEGKSYGFTVPDQTRDDGGIGDK